MKALFITSIREGGVPGRVELMDIPVPEPVGDEIRIKTAYTSICGSDAHIVAGDLGPLGEHTKKMLPMRLGHEMTGVIEKISEKAKRMGFNEGDRVIYNYAKVCHSCAPCRQGKENFCKNIDFRTNAMAEYICADVSQVHKIPDNLSLRKAVLVEPLTIAVGAVETARVSLGKSVAVMGGGGIGLMIAMLANKTGASKVAVFDIMPEKRELALKIGADAAFDPAEKGAIEKAMDFAGGEGYDCVFEGTGNLSAAKQTLELLAPDGDCVYYAMYGSDSTLPVDLFSQFYWNQKHLHGMKMGAGLFPKAINIAARLDLEALIQKEYPLSQYDKAFESMMSKKYAKVVMKMDD
jgi:(R,R)-butanediol dehydrogenase/meso-butanediol dehydrogenase/diacetyl reductase/L-iditol 2-dehydrogenase